MRGHNICFIEVLLKTIPKLSLLLLLIWSPALGVRSGGAMVLGKLSVPGAFYLLG